MTTGTAVVAEAVTWKGTPYQHQASVKNVAADCIGFVAGVARNLGMPEAFDYFAAPDLRGYGRQPDPDKLRAAADKYMRRIEIPSAQMGDVLVLRFHHDPMHFALVTRLDPLYIIHSVQLRGGVVEHRVDNVWRSRIMRAYRFKGVE
jgi:NlpC/P60 family putative phage cell wall peptidase